MDVNLQQEKKYPQIQFPLLENTLLPLGNSTKSKASFLSKASISSTMTFFQILHYLELIASLIDLGSSLNVDRTKAEWKSGGLYLSTSLRTWSDLLKARVYSSTSSSDLDNSSSKESYPSFIILNSIFSHPFSLGSSSFLEAFLASLKITSWL